MTETQSLGLGQGVPEPGDKHRLSVNAVIGLTLAAGLTAAVAVSYWSLNWPVPPYVVETSEVWPYLLFVLIAMISEIVYVPIRHGDGTEDLTFFEILVIGGALLFVPVMAIVLPLVGFVLADTLLGRPASKTLFNLGSYGLAASALVAIYGSHAASNERFSLPWLLWLIAGAIAFTAVNLVILSWILHVAEDVPVGQFLRDQWMLSVAMALGSTAVAAVAVELAATAPAMVPFALLPAAALWYAYRSASQHNSALERNRWMLALNTSLSRLTAPEELVPRATDQLRRVFLARGIITIVGETSFRLRGDDPRPSPAPVDDAERQLLAQATDEVAKLPETMLPDRWTRGYLIRLELADGEEGALVLGSTAEVEALDKILPWAKGEWQLADVDRPVLAALAASLGSAIRAGQHLVALRDETAKLTAVVDHATDGIVVFDGAGQTVVWSPAMQRITGCPFEWLATHDSAGAINAQLADLAQSAVAAPVSPGSEGESLEHSLVITRPDGESRELNVAVVTITEFGDGLTDEPETMSVLTVRDMTRERRVERMKSDFIATVSHELRTPITPIKGYAQLLLGRWQKMPEAKRENILGTILDRAEHLSRLVDDLLLASRVSELETTKLDIEMADIQLSDLVREVTAAFPDLSGRLTVTGHDALVRCDKVRAIQCLSNLLSNAAKYSPAESAIDVETLAPEAEVWAAVAVRDRGRGIPAAELDRVFEQFYRVEDPMTMTTGGSGLGLYISRELARAMGGDISVESTLGAGSTFELRLSKAGREHS